MTEPEQLLVFLGATRITQGARGDVIRTLLSQTQGEDVPPYLVFRVKDGQRVDINLASAAEAANPQRTRAPVPAAGAPVGSQKARGRPRLGVVGREVTLFPRHWEWLDRQRGGASAALRRIIDADRKLHADEDQVRQAQDATHRFMYAMAGNLAGFEEAMRALYAGDKVSFAHQIRSWPDDIRDTTLDFARDAFQGN